MIERDKKTKKKLPSRHHVVRAKVRSWYPLFIFGLKDLSIRSIKSELYTHNSDWQAYQLTSKIYLSLLQKINMYLV